MIIFRVDSSSIIGSGHIGRCLNLADAFQKKGFDSLFVTRQYQGNSIAMIKARGFAVEVLPPNSEELLSNDWSSWLPAGIDEDFTAFQSVCAKWLDDCDAIIIDHYAIDWRWEEKLPGHCRIIVFDDLGERQHHCDLIIHPNVDTDIQLSIASRHNGIPILSGVENIPFSRNLIDMKKQKIRKHHPPRKLVLFMGGGDPRNTTARVTRQLLQLDIPFIEALVLTGNRPGRRDEIQSIVGEDKRFRTECFVANFTEETHSADFFIGAGGGSLYERCLLRIPSLTIPISPSQIPFAKKLAELQFTRLLRGDWEIEDSEIRMALENYWKDKESFEFNQRALLFDSATGADSLCDRVLTHIRL